MVENELEREPAEAASPRTEDAELREVRRVLDSGRDVGVVALLSNSRWPRLRARLLAELRRLDSAGGGDELQSAAGFVQASTVSSAARTAALDEFVPDDHASGWRAGLDKIMRKQTKGRKATELPMVASNVVGEFRLRAVAAITEPAESYLRRVRAMARALPAEPGSGTRPSASGADHWQAISAQLAPTTPSGTVPDSLDGLLGDSGWTACFAHFLRIVSGSGPGMLAYLLSRARGDSLSSIVNGYIGESNDRPTENANLRWDLTWSEAVRSAGALDHDNDADLLRYVGVALARYDREARMRLNRMLTDFRRVAAQAQRHGRDSAMPRLDPSETT